VSGEVKETGHRLAAARYPLTADRFGELYRNPAEYGATQPASRQRSAGCGGCRPCPATL